MEFLNPRKEEHASLSIEGAEQEVVSVFGSEGLSKLFDFKILIRSSSDGPEPGTLIGKLGDLTIRDSFRRERHVHGVIAESARRVFDDGEVELTVSLRPEVFPLTLGRDSRVFNDMTVRQIVDRVLERSQAPKRWELTSKYIPHVYCAQYREDDWVFISRMLEEEGIYYWFDHEGEKSILVFSDDSTLASDIPLGPALISYIHETGMYGDDEQIDELGSAVHATPTKFTVGSFDNQKPNFKVMATEGDGIHEMYDAPGGGSENPQLCAKQARIRNEGAKAARSGITGTSSSIRLVPGTLLTIGGHARLDGRYLMTESSYVILQRRRFDEKEHIRPYMCSFKGIPAKAFFRAPEESPIAQQPGLQSGMVVGPPGEEIHPDDQGRVRVQLHWDREGGKDDKAGKWMRVAQRGTASSMLLPRIGWNVLTFMEEGAVDAPAVLSRVADAEHPPPYALPDNKTRTVFKTATTPGGGTFNEIFFEDKEGVQNLFMNASKDMNYLIQDSKGDNVSHDQTRKIGNNQDVTVERRFNETVTNDQTVTVSGNEEVTISGSRQKAVTGNETVDIGGDRKVKVGSNNGQNVKQSRKLIVGASVTEETTGNIQLRAADCTIEVTGSVTTKSEAMIGIDVTNGAEQKVGGDKFEYAGKDRLTDVHENYDETVTGAMTMESKAFFMDGADKTAHWEVAGGITGAAPMVHMDAKNKIELRCGASTLTITEGSIELKATSYDLSASSDIIALSKIIKHNP